MKKLFLISFLICAFGLHSFPWPWENPQIVRSFGDIRDQAVFLGLEIKGDSNKVMAPPSEGMVLFVKDPYTLLHQNLPDQLGFWASIDHDETRQSLIAGYQGGDHIPWSSSQAPLPREVLFNDLAPRTLLLFFLQKDENKMLNPLGVLEEIGLIQQSPRIPEVLVEITERKESFSVRNLINVPLGEVRFSFRAVVPLGEGNISGAIEVSAFLNGRKIFESSLKELMLQNGEWVIPATGMSLIDVYGEKGLWILAPSFLERGTHNLRITATNFLGDETQRDIRFIAQR